MCRKEIVVVLMLFLIACTRDESDSKYSRTSAPISIPTYLQYSSVKTPIYTKTPAPKFIVINGKAEMAAFWNQSENENSYFDLDTGRNGYNQNSDINYFMTCGSDCFSSLSTSNNAEIYLYFIKRPDRDDCYSKISSFKLSSDIQLLNEQYACVLTTEGNISIIYNIQYLGIIEESEQIEFEYSTWVQE
jgi:hypothetical protein